MNLIFRINIVKCVTRYLILSVSIKNVKFCNKWTLLHSNVRGLDSKSVSLRAILGTMKPDIVTLNETHYMHKRKISIAGYESYARNRALRSAGGVATLVDKVQSVFSSKVKEGDANDDFVITKHNQFEVPINILNWYSEIESRTCKSDIEDRWLRILGEITKIQ